jgi:primosomal protein N' (replication factor Y)
MEIRAETSGSAVAQRLLARVVIAGTSGGNDSLTYLVPPGLARRVSVGHRVLVPMRSRRLTGIVLEIGEMLETGGSLPKPIIELLEPQPLFDRAHLELFNFLASYYMAPLAEVYRNVIPATARVESHRRFYPGLTPMPLAAAAFTALERKILAAVTGSPRTLRQLSKLDDPQAVATAVRHLETERYIEQRDGIRGHHRQTTTQIVRLKTAPSIRAHGSKQRVVFAKLAEAGQQGIPNDQLTAGNEVVSRSWLRGLARRGVIELIDSPTFSSQTTDLATIEAPFELSSEQLAAISAIVPAIHEHRFDAYLLWGVTGSGKTEVYVRLAAEALKAGRQVLLLVPEIELANQVVQAFSERFGRLAAIVHSEQKISERWEGWMAALSGETRIIVGPRSAIFAPLRDIGLVVVDEEHDSAYKQEDGIRYNARDLAVALARTSGCPVVLGSATPSAESYANARRGRYKLLRLTRRALGRELAQAEVLDLRAQTVNAASGEGPPREDTGTAPVPLSPVLIGALRDNLAAGGQSIVFLNRRGYHNSLQCHLCGNVIACPNCSVSLTFHLRDRTIRCHYCGQSATAPERCEACGGYGLEGQGFGTERLAHAIAEVIPNARIERMDSDTSGRRGVRGAIVEALRRGALDIVVGTQMITKGFDFPGVTLVGVVLADLTLNLPDFRSAERTFQLLTQVAGRAGRGENPGRVLIQTYAPHHYSVRAARDQDYERFMRRELSLRRELEYPPFARLVMVRIEGADANLVNKIATQAAAILGRAAQPSNLRVLGPAPAPIERIKQRYRWQIAIKSQDLKLMRAALATMRQQIAQSAEHAKVRVVIDIDPINMM